MTNVHVQVDEDVASAPRHRHRLSRTEPDSLVEYQEQDRHRLKLPGRKSGGEVGHRGAADRERALKERHLDARNLRERGLTITDVAVTWWAAHEHCRPGRHRRRPQYPQHRDQEFLAFLNQLVRVYPRRALHVVLDNSSTHSTPEVKAWLQRHKRVHFHFTPTSASWMNMVEIWFSILTKQQVRRGVYHDVSELIAAIETFIEGYNGRAEPFVWTKTVETVLAKATKQQATSGTLR